METIIEEECDKLKRKLCGLSRILSVSEMELFARTEVNEMLLRILKAYAEELDLAIYEDKAGRKADGMVVERRNLNRQVLTEIGVLSYDRTYYVLKDGTYGCPVDTVIGVDPHQRVSDHVVLRLTEEAKKFSYSDSSRIVTNGNVSRQTVMNAVRRCRAKEDVVAEKRKVPVLHIDADEGHVSLQNGRNVMIPLATVYEGLEHIGIGGKGRNRCISPFQHGTCGIQETFWEKVYQKLDNRYDLDEVRIYLHGDGAAWIKQGLNVLPNCTFVLDSYHKNKAKKMAFGGCMASEATTEKRLLEEAFRLGDRMKLEAVWRSLLKKHPERRKAINQAMGYLRENLDAIAVRYHDAEARNGGATEPHISHTLSSRLSSRPMGWSRETLEHLVPILAQGTFELIACNSPRKEPKCIEKATKRITRHARKKIGSFLPNPDISLPFVAVSNGKVTQLYRALRDIRERC